jgi:hypothetical protein
VYTSNTFAFHEGNTLDLFLSKCLSSTQRSLISSIQLDGWDGEDYDPGRKVRPETLRHLKGLKALCIAVTNAYMNYNLSAFHFHSLGESGTLGIRIEEEKMQKSEGRGEIVKVTVDRLENGWVEALELERLVKRNVEAALGFK